MIVPIILGMAAIAGVLYLGHLVTPKPPKPLRVVYGTLRSTRGWQVTVTHDARTTEPNPLWQPGSAAFWLDPDLWLRTPEVEGRPALCWMHLDDPVLDARRRDLAFENCSGFGGALWYAAEKRTVVRRRPYYLAAFQCEQVIRDLLPRYSSSAIHEDALALMYGRPTARQYGSGTHLEALQAVASQLLRNRDDTE